jgi:hypothetical protein
MYQHHHNAHSFVNINLHKHREFNKTHSEMMKNYNKSMIQVFYSIHKYKGYYWLIYFIFYFVLSFFSF